MANPQKENGYTSIANEIIEALARIRVSGEARQCLDVIFRQTYGFHKKDDYISLSQFALKTGLKTVPCAKAIRKLLDMNLVSITKKGYRGMNMYRFNKDYTTWRPIPKKVVVKTTITNIGKPLLPKKVYTKDNIQKKEYIADKSAKVPSKEKIDFKRYESLYLSLLAEYRLPKVMINYGKFRKNIPKVLSFLNEQGENIENYWRWYLDQFRIKEGGRNILATEKFGTEPSTTLSTFFINKFINEK